MFKPGDKVKIKPIIPLQNTWKTSVGMCSCIMQWMSDALLEPSGVIWTIDRRYSNRYSNIGCPDLWLITSDDPTLTRKTLLWVDETWIEPAQAPGGMATMPSVPVSPLVPPSFNATAVKWPRFIVSNGFTFTEPPMDVASDAPSDREFDGFCNPCGGFRTHRLQCPTKRSSK